MSTQLLAWLAAAPLCAFGLVFVASNFGILWIHVDQGKQSPSYAPVVGGVALALGLLVTPIGEFSQRWPLAIAALVVDPGGLPGMLLWAPLVETLWSSRAAHRDRGSTTSPIPAEVIGEYDVVRVVRVDPARHYDGVTPPRVGDVGAVCHDYAPGDPNGLLAVEMNDSNGSTIWLADFRHDELVLVERWPPRPK